VPSFKKKIVSARVKYFSTGLKTQVDYLPNKALRGSVNTAHYAQQAEYYRRNSPSVSQTLREHWYAGILGRVEANPLKTLAELNTGKYDGNLSQRVIMSHCAVKHSSALKPWPESRRHGA
jgi:hypothetical protein